MTPLKKKKKTPRFFDSLNSSHVLTSYRVRTPPASTLYTSDEQPPQQRRCRRRAERGARASSGSHGAWRRQAREKSRARSLARGAPPSPIAAAGYNYKVPYARESGVVVVDSGLLLLLLLHGVVWWGAHVAVILAARSMPQGNDGVGRVGHPVLTPRAKAACRCVLSLPHSFFCSNPETGVRGAETQESCS